MTIDRLLELLAIERLCVLQNMLNRCDRDCANCNLVQKDTEIIEMYEALEHIVANYNLRRK